MMCLKYVRLMMVRFVRRILSKLPTMFSYIFLVFSAAVCFIILLPNCFDRVPILPYLISKHELPITYELSGEVKVLDENGDIINKNVEVFVGGYSTSLVSPKFTLKFSSPMTDEVFAVIRYEVDGEILQFTKCLPIKDRKHEIKEEFIIYAESF